MTCLPLSEQSTSDVLRGNCLFQVDRGPTGRNVLASWQISSPPLFSRLTVQTSLFNCWTRLIRGAKGGDNGIHIFDVLPLAAAVCPSATVSCSLQSDPTSRQPHNAPTLQTAWTIQQVTSAEFHILEIQKLRACNSCACSLGRDLRTSSVSL